MTLSGKDKKQYLKEVSNLVEGVEDLFHKKSNLKIYTGENVSVLGIDGSVMFILTRNMIIPSIHLLRKYKSKMPKITVDVGAIRFVTNGADIMRPGITAIDDKVVEGGLVTIVEETKGSLLGIGKALYDRVDMSEMKAGKVVKNLHYLKDEYWSMRL